MGSHTNFDHCEKAVIIVAGGSGLRLGGSTPKQFLEIEGKAVLLHSIDAFLSALEEVQMIVALHADYHDWWKEKTEGQEAYKDVVVCHGGKTRTESVKKAMFSLGRSIRQVAIHDAVRPLVGPDMIRRVLAATEQYPAVVPSIPLHDSIRRKGEGNKNEPAKRDDFIAIQTPQAFQRAVIESAYQKVSNDQVFSDDASLVEEIEKIAVYLVEGELSNLKITRPEDLLMVEFLLWKRHQATK